MHRVLKLAVRRLHWLKRIIDGVPAVMVGLQFLVPARGENVRLHRRLLTSAFPGQPRWRWFVLLLLSIAVWYGFLCWYQLYRVYSSPALRILEQKGVSRRKQMIDLLYLTLILGVEVREVRSYYQLQLHECLRRDWMDFVFPQELSNWHSAYSYSVDDPSVTILSDKKRFADFMMSQGIACVPTLFLLKRGAQIDLTEMGRYRGLFFKPRTGHASRGCFSYCRSRSTDERLLSAFDPEMDKLAIAEIVSLEQSETFINQQCKNEDYLVQPLLSNHAFLAETCGDDALITLRVISGLIDDKPCLIYTLLEIPLKSDQGWWVMNVDCATGLIEDLNRDRLGAESDLLPMISELTGKLVPHWDDSRFMIMEAHRQFMQIKTIAWDMALTPEGPRLIEGNVGWGVDTIQTVSKLPMLKSKLREVYS
jgi:hypothetical protein